MPPPAWAFACCDERRRPPVRRIRRLTDAQAGRAHRADIGGARADRCGCWRLLLFASSLVATGNLVAGCTSSHGLVFLFLLVIVVGSGLFKPVTSGTIDRTTTERASTLGFGIHYWAIDLGAFAAPLVVTRLKGLPWQAVFPASAAYMAAMPLPAALWRRGRRIVRRCAS